MFTLPLSVLGRTPGFPADAGPMEGGDADESALGVFGAGFANDGGVGWIPLPKNAKKQSHTCAMDHSSHKVTTAAQQLGTAQPTEL